MKSLQTCSLFQLEDRNTQIKKKMLSFNKNTDVMPFSNFEENLMLIKKRYSFSLVQAVYDEIDAGTLIFRRNPSSIFPSYMPAYMYVLDGKIVSIIPIDKFCTQSKNGQWNMDMRTTYALLQTGMIMLRLHKQWNYTLFNQDLAEVGALCWSAMFCKVLDKLVALNLNTNKSNAVRYLAGKFFLLNLLERKPSDNIENIACKCCTSNFTGKESIYMQLDNFDDSLAFTNFENFCKVLFKMDNLGMKGMSFLTFLNTFVQFYGPSALWSLEYLPFFLHTLFAVNIGANLNQAYVIESLLGKKIDVLYSAIVAIIK